MLYELHNWENGPSFVRVFQYVTMRTIGGAATAFTLSMILGPSMIKWLTRLKVGQAVRDDEVLAMQRSKAGTPTMGGLLIIVTVVISSFLWAKPGNVFVLLTVATMVWMGAIGFVDDYLKVKHKTSKGLAGRWKLLLQATWVMIAFGFILNHPDLKPEIGKLMMPFLKDPVIQDMGLPFTFVFMLLVMVGASNAVNLTDGLDGLAIGCSNSVAVAYLVMAYAAGHRVFADYLQVPYIADAGEIAVFFGCLLGAGLGFLWFNCHPARVFMGDTGSLALGGAIAMGAILIKQELVLIFVGGVFVMEALSVVLQVASFKITGKRIFRCSPVHHHFEMKAREDAEREGRNVEVVETMVTIRFWILSIIFAIVGIATLKLR
ncbi:MAG: phospho-N-acetylmuramoyl-pentapeptide-transferase [Verrucomicrobiota bacterium]